MEQKSSCVLCSIAQWRLLSPQGVDEETDFFPFNHYNCPKEAIEDWSTVTHKELTELETEMRKQKLDLFPWQDSSICTHPNVLNIPLDQ